MKIGDFARRVREYYNSHWQASLIIIFSALMFLMLMEVKNHRFRSNDFKVYYRAAERLVDGENLYRPVEDGHYYYKYSPTAAAYFIPISVLPLGVAKVIHWTVMAVIACLGFYLALLMVRPAFRDEDPRVINNLLLLLALILGVHLEREFFLGQVNQILFVSFLAMILLIKKGYDLTASFIWAGSIFLKPFGLIFLPYYLIKKRFKPVLLFFLFAALFALVPMPFTGISNFAGQYRLWFHEIGVELAWKESLLADGNDTIFSLLARYSPLRLLNFTSDVTRIYQVIILAIIALLFLYIYNRGRNIKDSYVLETGFLVALIPMLEFTNNYAFQFIGLAAFIVVFNFRRLSRPWRFVAVMGLVLSGFNMHDLWGETLYTLFYNLSLVGIGAILVQATLVNLRFRDLA